MVVASGCGPAWWWWSGAQASGGRKSFSRPGGRGSSCEAGLGRVSCKASDPHMYSPRVTRSAANSGRGGRGLARLGADGRPSACAGELESRAIRGRTERRCDVLPVVFACRTGARLESPARGSPCIPGPCGRATRHRRTESGRRLVARLVVRRRESPSRRRERAVCGSQGRARATPLTASAALSRLRCVPVAVRAHSVAFPSGRAALVAEVNAGEARAVAASAGTGPASVAGSPARDACREGSAEASMPVAVPNHVAAVAGTIETDSPSCATGRGLEAPQARIARIRCRCHRPASALSVRAHCSDGLPVTLRRVRRSCVACPVARKFGHWRELSHNMPSGGPITPMDIPRVTRRFGGASVTPKPAVRTVAGCSSPRRLGELRKAVNLARPRARGMGLRPEFIRGQG